MSEPTGMCEAFRATAARDPAVPALRMPGEGVLITWRTYAAPVPPEVPGFVLEPGGTGDVATIGGAGYVRMADREKGLIAKVKRGAIAAGYAAEIERLCAQ